jgi:hypothetical protein
MEHAYLINSAGFIYKTMASVLIVVLGLFILMNNPKSSINKITLLLAICAGGSSCFSSLLDGYALLFNRITPVAVYGFPLLGAFIPSALLHFHLVYPPSFKNLKKWHLFFIYLPTVFFVYLSISLKYIYGIESVNNKPVISYTPFYIVYSAYTALSFLACIASLVLKKRIVENKKEKANLDYLIKFELSVAAVLVIGYLMPYYVGDFYVYETGLFAYFIMIAYSIVKYQAFDIRTAIHYTLVWIILFLMIIAPVVVVPFAVQDLFKGKNPASIMAVYGLLTIAYYFLVNSHLFPVVRKTLLRRNKELSAKVNAVRNRIENAGTFEAFEAALSDELQGNLYAKKVSVSYGDRRIKKDGTNLSEAELAWLEECDPVVTRKRIAELAPDGGVLHGETHLALKIENDGEDLGYALLGEKRNLRNYDFNDMAFLNQIATSINVTLFRLMVSKRATELEVIARLKETLFVNLAHETKTPLAVIRANLEKFMKHAEITPEIESIKANIDRLQRDMINFLDA